MNAINVLRPYKWEGMWVFDDPAHALVHEPFVAGSDAIIDAVVQQKGIKDADNGFLLLFSDQRFPSADMQLTLIDEEGGGHVYSWRGSGMTGWLCPALLHYFPQAPESIWVQIKAIGADRDRN